jgi:hypothetical protein
VSRPLEVVNHDLFRLLHLHLKISVSIVVIDEKVAFDLVLGDEGHVRPPFPACRYVFV